MLSSVDKAVVSTTFSAAVIMMTSWLHLFMKSWMHSWVKLGAPPVQVFKAYDMSGSFLAGPISVIDFFGSQLGGRFTNAACACTNHALPLHCEENRLQQACSDQQIKKEHSLEFE